VDRNEVLEDLRRYQSILLKWPAERCPSDYDRPGMGRQVKHARWMLDEMIRRIEADQVSASKANRWLGFVQCIFWVNGLHTIGEMKDQDRGPGNEP
jgi:hypothetical protein